MADVNVTDLTQETYESLDGNEQIIMFDSVEGKRATVKAVGDYILKKLALSGTSSIQDLLGNKVDKVTGKGLSANDFTTTLKTKLDGIESGAEENVQVDWSVTDSTSDAFIKNKPTIPSAVTVDSSFSSTSTNPVQNQVINTALNGKVDKVTGKSLSTNDFTSELKTKLEGIATGAEVNVQVDWNETNSGSDAFIKNKPTIPPAVTVDSSLSGTSTNPVQNQVINTALGNKVDKVTGKGLSTNDYTTNEKNKLSNIESGAEVNQNAFSQVKVGNTTIYADSKEDVVEFVAGNNINITPDATNDKLTIEGAYTNATKLADGLMSATDKENLDDAVDLIGNTTMGTTATTITGAIAEHEQDISDLNSKITHNITNGKIIKTGNIIMLCYTAYSSITLPINTWSQLMTLPEGFRPSVGFDTIINNNDGRSSNPASLICILRIDGDGTVKIWPYVENPAPRFAVTFICGD